MDESFSAEIYRQDGAVFRAIRLSVDADGSVKLDAQDMGGITREVWDDDDYEFWVTVPAPGASQARFRPSSREIRRPERRGR